MLAQGGTYDVVATMENSCTAADLNIPTTVSTGTTIKVIDNATVASISTIESSPQGDVQVGSPATYTIQSRSANGDAQPTETDEYTVTLTCIALKYGDPLCDDDVFTMTATHTTGGLYSATVTPTVGGNYSVVVTLDNDVVDRRRNLVDYDTNVVSEGMTLVVLDDTTVPSASTFDNQQEEVMNVNDYAVWILQSRSADGRAIDTDTDNFQITLICLYEEEQYKKHCRKSLYQGTAVPQGDGLYKVYIKVNTLGVYDVIATMKNDYTDANPDVSTTVTGSILKVVKETKSEDSDHGHHHHHGYHSSYTPGKRPKKTYSYSHSNSHSSHSTYNPYKGW